MKYFLSVLTAAAAIALLTPFTGPAPFKASVSFAKNGADDPAGHDRGDHRHGRGKDDGRGHH